MFFVVRNKLMVKYQSDKIKICKIMLNTTIEKIIYYSHQ